MSTACEVVFTASVAVVASRDRALPRLKLTAPLNRAATPREVTIRFPVAPVTEARPPKSTESPATATVTTVSVPLVVRVSVNDVAVSVMPGSVSVVVPVLCRRTVWAGTAPWVIPVVLSCSSSGDPNATPGTSITTVAATAPYRPEPWSTPPEGRGPTRVRSAVMPVARTSGAAGLPRASSPLAIVTLT